MMQTVAAMLRVTLSMVGLGAALVSAHAKWTCPTPRSEETGLKTAPCGGIGSVSAGSQLVVSPGPLTVSFVETIVHSGSPFRIALSRDGEEGDSFESCILLNHIPHNPSAQSPQDYDIQIDIPDVTCERCSLQLIQPMTDKTTNAAQYPDGCRYDYSCLAGAVNCQPPQCFSVYHSCANIKIVNGSTPRNDFTCPASKNLRPGASPSMFIQENPLDGAQWENGLLKGTAELGIYSGNCTAQGYQTSDGLNSGSPGTGTKANTPNSASGGWTWLLSLLVLELPLVAAIL